MRRSAHLYTFSFVCHNVSFERTPYSQHLDRVVWLTCSPSVRQTTFLVSTCSVHFLCSSLILAAASNDAVSHSFIFLCASSDLAVPTRHHRRRLRLATPLPRAHSAIVILLLLLLIRHPSRPQCNRPHPPTVKASLRRLSHRGALSRLFGPHPPPTNRARPHHRLGSAEGHLGC